MKEVSELNNEELMKSIQTVEEALEEMYLELDRLQDVRDYYETKLAEINDSLDDHEMYISDTEMELRDLCWEQDHRMDDEEYQPCWEQEWEDFGESYD